MNTPKEVIEAANKYAIVKGGLPLNKMLVLAILAGVYIGFGGLLAIVVGGGSPGIAAENPGIARFLFGAAFPLGLILVVLVGAELFTGNTAYFIPNILNGRQSILSMMRNWLVVYLGNFIGAVALAYFLVHLTHLVSEAPYLDKVIGIATSKTSHSFTATFLKGIGANWLVCLALWQGMSSPTVSGKVISLWWPVMAFVTFGFEHSVANMFFIPLAIFEGAEVSWATFIFANLIPATLGNIVGGALFVGGAYWYLYGKDKKEKTKLNGRVTKNSQIPVRPTRTNGLKKYQV